MVKKKLDKCFWYATGVWWWDWCDVVACLLALRLMAAAPGSDRPVPRPGHHSAGDPISFVATRSVGVQQAFLGVVLSCEGGKHLGAFPPSGLHS